MFASIICVFMGSDGKKNVCKTCARKAAVQIMCKPKSPRNLCKLCAKNLARLGACLARGLSRPSPGGKRRVRGLKTRLLSFLSAGMVTGKRGLNQSIARPGC